MKARDALIESLEYLIPYATQETSADLILAGLWLCGFKITPLTDGDIEQAAKDKIAALRVDFDTFDPGEVLYTSEGRPVVVGLGEHDLTNVVRAPFGRNPPDDAA